MQVKGIKVEMMYKVVEKFVSINGEGKKAGQLAAFIRFAGCNLRCSYCDTMWANEEDVQYELMSKEDIYIYIKSTGVINVTLTGGEPLIQEGIYELLLYLVQDNSIRVEIETNGSIDIKRFTDIQANNLVFTIDYKLATSSMEFEMKVSNYDYLKSGDSVKFVVGSTEDLQKAKNIIVEYMLIDKCNVQISPVFGKIYMTTIVEFMKDNKMNRVKLQPQLHKIIWKPETRGV